MKTELFTQEGNKYIVRTANTTFSPTLGGAQSMNKMVYINVANPASYAIDPFYLAFETTKKIIPIAYSLSGTDNNNNNAIVVDVSNCYFSVASGPNKTLLPSYYTSLGKIFPYVERIYYTDNNNNNFISRYNQIVFSDNDFISTTDPLAIQANSSLASAFNNVLPLADRPLLPASTLTITISLTYLELQ